MITRQDIFDSFNIFHPKKYLKARLKLLPYILGTILAIMLLSVVIQLLLGRPFSDL